MGQSRFPSGWDENRVKVALAHYEAQSEEEAVAEDEAAFEAPNQTVMEVPTELVPARRPGAYRKAQKRVDEKEAPRYFKT